VDFSSSAEIFGVDGVIVLIVVVLVLFGSTKIPKLARSLGSAQKEFKKGIEEGASQEGTDAGPVLQVVPPAAAGAPAQTTVTVDSTAAGSPGTA
jgi:sec-independent protein translocase protein TatA